MEKFIVDHQSLIIAISAVAQALAAIFLFFITKKYVLLTKEIVDLNKKEFDSNNRPFIFISDFFIDNNPPSLRLVLTNSGKLPAKIKLNVLGITFYIIGNKDDKLKQEILSVLEKMQYYAFPGQNNLKIGYPLTSDDLKNKIETHDGFFLNATLEYWQLGKISSKKMRVETIINFRTKRGSCYDGIIHDIQTNFAD